VLSLSGWVPAQRQKQVEEFLNQYPAWYSIETPRKGESIPVLLRNNPTLKLFEPITRIFQLPNYFELDPTFAIAPFFAIFFGTCLGDTGYGLVIFALATAARLRLSGAIKAVAALGQILGVFTLVMGTVNTGVIFGITIADHLDVPGFALLHRCTVIRQDVTINPFNFALLLGVIQMMFGMVLNIYGNIRYNSLREAVPGIARILLVGSCILLFLILYQKMDALKPFLVFAVVGAGLGLACFIYVAFFTDLEQFLGNPIADLLLKLYFVLSGAVGDILSYIRLFALGLSSGVLGYVINVIALQMRDAIPVLGWPIFVAFLVVGHSANLLLAGLGSFVHPLRLTFVEFYNNLVFKGGGIEYRPLKRNS
jgi:V/A-type H+-transporting ATPase subunit I